MHQPKANHWGRWVMSRSQLVGFRRGQDLAAAVGCTRERIVRWASLALPPRFMRKGFDASLARALKTDRHTLFAEFATLAPESAPLLDARDSDPAESLKRKCHAVVELLDAAALRKLHDQGRALLKQEMATSAA